MKVLKRYLAITLAVVLALTAVPMGAAAAKKAPLAMSRKSVSVVEGKKTTIKLKRATKNTKVTWKTSNKKS